MKYLRNSCLIELCLYYCCYYNQNFIFCYLNFKIYEIVSLKAIFFFKRLHDDIYIHEQSVLIKFKPNNVFFFVLN